VPCDPPHWGRRDCLDCGRRGPWVKAPWSAERAANFMMPFGKHKGTTIGKLAQSESGRSYLRWAAENIKGNVGIAAKIALGQLDPEEAAQ
jgi:hypothetical protein